jgi:cytoskeletal protein CcmA (bactofilin family)
VRVGAVVLALGLMGQMPPVTAADDAQARASLGGDVFVAGGAPAVHEPVAGDLFVAGGSVEVDGAVSGDTLAAGGKLQLNGDVGRSVYVAGGQLIVNGKVGGHARLAGGRVELGPKADVTGNLSVAGGQVRLLGTVGGDVRAAGGRLWIDGSVGGNVVATTGQIALGPNARIAGTLRFSGGDSVQRDPAAQVTGGIESWTSWGHDDGARPPSHRGRLQNRAMGWPWTLGLTLLAAVLLAALPGFQARVGRTLQQRPVLSVLLGLAWLLVAPLVLLLLLLTVIGIPLTALGVVLYIVLLPLAYVSTAIALGDWALQAWRSAPAGQWTWRAGAAALVLLLLSQATRVPWLGDAVLTLALLAGLGALALQLLRQPQAR